MLLPYEELGRRFYPPFRKLTEESEMLESYPSWFWVVGTFIHPMKFYRDDIPQDAQLDILSSAQHGLEMFLNEAAITALLPRSSEKAKNVHAIVHAQFVAIGTGQTAMPNPEVLRKAIYGFGVSLQDELDRILTYTVTPKGSLDARALAKKFSQTYPKRTRELLNDFICEDIDHAGSCLAFELPTSSGLHILRAVETCAKAYVHAATGKLPGIKNRNWGEYIEQLEKSGAHKDVIDLLRILKAKRNPLMHPYDNLSIDEAISLLCICQAGIDTIVEDLHNRTLEVKFQDSLKLLPTL